MRKLWTSKRQVRALMNLATLQALKLTAWARRPDSSVLEEFLLSPDSSPFDMQPTTSQEWLDKTLAKIKQWELANRKGIDVVEDLINC